MTETESEALFNGGWTVVPLDVSPEDSAQRKRFIRQSHLGAKGRPQPQEQE